MLGVVVSSPIFFVLLARYYILRRGSYGHLWICSACHREQDGS